jgi:hypothetical protein
LTIEEANAFLKRYCEQQSVECDALAERIEKLLPDQVASIEQKGRNEAHAKGLREIAQTFRHIARDL